MSIVTTVLGKLGFMHAISIRVSWVTLKLAPKDVAKILSHRARAWSSPSMSRAFNVQHNATRAYLEARAKFPTPR